MIRIKSLKGFIEMKKEQYMMRKLDKIIQYFRSNDSLSDWPEYAIGKNGKIYELEDKIHDLEVENDKLFYYMLFLEERLGEAMDRINELMSE